jgi:eukaryotic-like serine/threonine-protein kinase
MSDPPSTDGSASGFLPAGWPELALLLDVVLDAPVGSRDRVLDEVSAGDPVRRAELTQLLADGERDISLLDAPAMDSFPGVADDAPALPPLLGERYRTGRELGRGGMARVYLAHDLKHGRDVAVKVIRRELAASLGRERFLREIAIAARLRHPNIVPLFDSGDVDGVLYFVMPYEEGPSLGTRLAASGPLPMAEALSILRDVARALQYAHAHNVVHRDIKPDNVMLSGGAAVVADFGIAKAVSAAQAEPTGNTITQIGSGVGTPAYMAPEQAVGDPSSDHRADVYSFGCLAYELLTGKPPFHDLLTHQIIAAHMHTIPRPVSDARVDTPPPVVQLVARCLEKEPDDRPQSATAILAMLESGATMAAPTRSKKMSRSWRPGLIAGGLAVLLAASVTYFVQQRDAVAPPPITLAVLPFGNIGGDSALLASTLGLGDEVFTALQRVPRLQMRSRNGARAFAGHLGVDEREVGKKLLVDYVVEGDMREESGRWLVIARLTRTADATELWSQKFAANDHEQLVVAEQIANEIAAQLRQRFPMVLGATIALKPNQVTTDPEAHRLYVLGQELLSRRGQSVSESADRFRAAIQRDSMYAGAYAGLSMALALYPYFEPAPPADVEAELTRSAARALQLDSTMSQPHVALALAAQHRWDWKLAEQELLTALRLAPTDVEAHVQYGRLLLRLGRFIGALQELSLARVQDPASPLVLSWVAHAFIGLDQMDSALTVSTQSVQGNVQNYTATLAHAQALLLTGRRDSARALIARMNPLRPNGAFIMAAAGDSTLAWSKVRALNAAAPRSAFVHTAEAYLLFGIGDTTRALAALELATDAHEMWPELTGATDRAFDRVRGSERFHAILRRVGLPLPPLVRNNARATR